MANTPGPLGSQRFLWDVSAGSPALCVSTPSPFPTTLGRSSRRSSPAPSVSGGEAPREVLVN